MKEWINNNPVLFWFISLFLGALLFKILWFFVDLFCAIKISHIILKNNRTRLRGDDAWGKHYADRFIDIWNQKHLQEGEKYYLNNFKCQDSYFTLKAIDKKLIDLKLIKDLNNPINNLRNKLIYTLCKTYLIYFIGDKKDGYEELEGKT